MSQIEHVDVLILGSGQGGKQLAWHLGRTGHRVAVVERQWVGGSCPAVACLPSKNEIWSSRIAHLTRHAGDAGTVTGPVRVDMAKVRQRKRDMVAKEDALHLQMYSSTGAEIIMGVGHLIKPKVIEVKLNDGGTRTLTGDNVVLNLGTHAAIPDVPGLRQAEPLTHIGALELDYAPAHLVVIGGGYIGIEMAQAYRRFGSRVTIVEHGKQLMGREDADIAEEMHRILTAEGIDIVLGAELVKVDGKSGKGVALHVLESGTERVIQGTDVLVATGRIPNTTGIGLEEAGIKLDARGFILVNDRLQTTAPDVWAIGEAAGSPQFTHASVDDFRIVRDNLAGKTRSKKDRLVPYTMFTDPPLAHVGLNEREAARQGIEVRVATLPMANVLRTMATDERQGMLKVIVGTQDDRVLGFTMLGAEAGEVMTVMQTAILGRLAYPTLRDAVISHLTYAEAIGPLLSRVPALQPA
ncbi:FAD-dependent NAD(P)-disulfide oxidoreductase [Pararobbsia alpina]|uniref:FAD-dependent oxidoreductase n=1 Tax=Pararobbsia alpina TaxID=621374 RepID=UPI0039A4CC0E